MRIAFAASLCLAMFACGQGGSLSGNSGRKTADSRSSRSSGESKDTTKNKTDEQKTEQASQDDDTTSDDTRVVAPEVITRAYLTCGAVASKAQPQPEGVKYFGCNAVDADKQRIDLKNVKVQFVLRDLVGTALDVPTVSLPDADKDVVWAVPVDVYAKGVNPEAKFPNADGSEGPTVPRKCFLKIGNDKDGYKDQESQCNAPA